MNEFLTRRVAKATFNATGGKAIGTHSLGMIIPKGAIITNVFYNVTTTFTTANDSGTIALQAIGANDLKAAIAISDATNVWDAGLHGCLPGNWALDGNALTAIAMAAGNLGATLLTTAAVTPAVVIAVQDLTAGVMDVYFEYISA